MPVKNLKKSCILRCFRTKPFKNFVIIVGKNKVHYGPEMSENGVLIEFGKHSRKDRNRSITMKKRQIQYENFRMPSVSSYHYDDVRD